MTIGGRNLSKEMYVLDKNFILDPKISDNCLLAYVVLMIAKRKRRVDYFPYEYLCFQSTDRIQDKIIISKVKKGIKELESLKIVKLIQETKIGKQLDIDKLFMETDSHNKKIIPFVSISRDELQKILNSGLKHRMSMLRYFLCVISTLSSVDNQTGYLSRKGVAYRSIESLSDLAKINRNTVFHYNKWLEENGLLYINHSYDVVLDDKGRIEKGIPNCYGRPQDYNAINALQFAIHQNCSMSRQMKSLSKNANQRRTVAQKINHLQKGKEYTYKTLKTLYAFCEQSNNDKQHELDKLNEMMEKNQITEFDAQQRRNQINSRSDYDLEYIKNKMEEAKIRQIQKEGGG